MVESKAYEKLGVLRPRRTLGGFVKSLFRMIMIVGILGVCAWIAIRLVAKRDKRDSAVAVNQIAAKDDGSLYLCEHLAVQGLPHVDARTREVDGRIVAVHRQYWFKVTIDGNWYFKRFVPAVKKYIAEIAPDVEPSGISLDTRELAYANDGADRLQRMSGSLVEGDAFNWQGVKKTFDRRVRTASGGRSVMLIDSVDSAGNDTHAVTYDLNEAQFAKFENWISRNVIRDRVGISATLTSGDEEVGSGEWTSSGIRPVGSVRMQGKSFYAVSPWLDVMRGIRCKFLGMRVARLEGVPDNVSPHWSL